MVEVLGAFNNAVFVENSVLAQSAIDGSSQAGLGPRNVDVAILVCLVEQSNHIVTLAELCHFGPNANDLAGTI